jgi:UDPglucose--hexose-1-phosphate uridylyltransferase
MLDLKEHPHRRLNPLTGEWVLVSPHRTARPWQGQVEGASTERAPEYDPSCYLCPGNERAGGVRNPKYSSTFVFDNDFAALMANTPSEQIKNGDLLIAEGDPGICRVVCFSPRHDLTLSQMSVPEIRTVVDLWGEQFTELGERESIRHVQIFENRGAMMGASNPHPHCQIWATHDIPNEPRKELQHVCDYFNAHRKCLVCEYLNLEEGAKERIVLENRDFVALVPFWAIWPFETLVLPLEHCGDLNALSDQARSSLADILQRLTSTYDNLFRAPFPYTMGFHQRPTDGKPYPEWHMHAHFYPPLLRSATIRKFMVGFELLGSPQRDITAETSAERLRAAIR